MSRDKCDGDRIRMPGMDDMADVEPRRNQLIMTPLDTYILGNEQKCETGRYFEAKRRLDGGAFRIEFSNNDDDSRSLKRIRHTSEATILHVLKYTVNRLHAYHLHHCVDWASHQPLTFLIFPNYDQTVPEFLDGCDAEDKGKSLSLVLSVHSFIALRNLHQIEIIHGNFKPDNLLIGTTHNSRRIMLANFECSTSATREIQAADPTDYHFSSRGCMRKYEPSAKDDIESWLYSVAWFFKKELLPWNDLVADSNSYMADMLKLKRAFSTLKLWKATRELMFEEYKDIITLMGKVFGKDDPPYNEIWNLLISAAKNLEVDVLGIPPVWSKNNRGYSTDRSQYSCNPVNYGVNLEAKL